MLSDVHREEKQTKNKRPVLDLMPPSPLLFPWALLCLWLMRWGSVKVALHEPRTALDAKKPLKITLYAKKKAVNYLLSSFLNKIHQPDHINDKHWLCLMYLSEIQALMMNWEAKLGILSGKQC